MKNEINYTKCLHLAWSYTIKIIQIHRKDLRSIADFA